MHRLTSATRSDCTAARGGGTPWTVAAARNCTATRLRGSPMSTRADTQLYREETEGITHTQITACPTYLGTDNTAFLPALSHHATDNITCSSETEGITWVAAAKSYSSSPVTEVEMAAFRRDSNHWQGKGRLPAAGGVSAGLKSRGMLLNAKRMTFHSLLHQYRYATTRLMSKFTSRPCTAVPAAPT